MKQPSPQGISFAVFSWLELRGRGTAHSLSCALHFVASYLDDLKSGFIKEYLPRTRLSHYIIGKLTACILSGGVCLVLGVLIFYGCAVLGLLPLETALEEGAEAANWLEPLLKVCILVFCSGGFWSLTGMTMAALTRSKYMAYASPFIFYYVLVILCERYFKKLYVFYPKEWINPAEWTGGVWGVVLLLAELSALLILIFAITAQRRLRNGFRFVLTQWYIRRNMSD